MISEDKLAKELQEKVSKQVDEFIIERIVYLFKEGILELSCKKPDVRVNNYPEYALKEQDNISFQQKWYLKFKGEEKYFEMKNRIKELEELLEIEK